MSAPARRRRRRAARPARRPDPEATPVLSIAAAGALAGWSPSAAYRAADRGEIPVLWHGRRRLVPTRAWLAVLDGDALIVPIGEGSEDAMAT
jgi:hypothetical protein